MHTRRGTGKKRALNGYTSAATATTAVHATSANVTDIQNARKRGRWDARNAKYERQQLTRVCRDGAAQERRFGDYDGGVLRRALPIPRMLGCRSATCGVHTGSAT